ncbi:hypothetical protein RSOL_084740, partial [Rhizoctonia solani AG-3 Rhs1AP]
MMAENVTLGQLNLANNAFYAPALPVGSHYLSYRQPVAPAAWPAQKQPAAAPGPHNALARPPFNPHHPLSVPNPPNPLAPAIPISGQPHEPRPATLPYRMIHGPLQAERLEMHDAKALEKARQENDKAVEKEQREQKRREDRERKEQEKEEDRMRKEADKQQREEEWAAKEKKKQEEKMAREKRAEEKAEEKTRREKEKAEEKERKEREKALTAENKKSKAAAPKSEGDRSTRRTAGDSDAEIDAAGKSVTNGDIKPIIMNPSTKTWSEQEILDLVKYILSVWANFKLKQAPTFRFISKYILHGSKDKDQVANQWNNLWKKFKACIQLEDQDSDVEVLNDEPPKEDAKKKVAKKAKEKINGFTESQLDAFEQTEVYRLILEVVGSDPEVAKTEEFDSAQLFSDSKDTNRSLKSPSSKSGSSDMTGMLEKTFHVVTTSMAGITESRKAAAEAATRREEREVVAAEAERNYRERQYNLDERRLRIDEDEHQNAQWDRVHTYLKSGDAMLVARGRRLAARLEREELAKEAEMADKVQMKD